MNWQKDAMAHAVAEDPAESCGLVVELEGGLAYWRCRNLAAPGLMADNFILDPADYRRASEAGRIVAVVHSHPRSSPEPSPSDITSCNTGRLPWHICSPRLGEWAVLLPRRQELPLLGRPWVWGVSDCWSLVRDWYRIEKGILLRDFDRPPTPEEFHRRPLFDELWPEAGFVQVDQDYPKPGDVALMAVGGRRLNHVGVLLENGTILHHLRDRLSEREIYGSDLIRATGRLVRHRELT